MHLLSLEPANRGSQEGSHPLRDPHGTLACQKIYWNAFAASSFNEKGYI